MELAFLQLAMTTLVNISFALMVGVLAAQTWLLHADAAVQHGAHQQLARALVAGFTVGAGASLVSLWQASATMADVPLLDSGPRVWTLFADTSYGRFGLASFAILALGATVHFTSGRQRQSLTYRSAIPCLLMAFAACRVATGHAAEGGLFTVAAAVELGHVLAMALWLGSVLVAGWVVLPQAEMNKAAGGHARYLASLSSSATVALAGVLATGLFNAFRVLHVPYELGSTGYGWALVTKLSFVGIAIVLGGWNRCVGFPAVVANSTAPDGAGNRMSAIVSVLRVESLALVVVVIAAAFLTTNAPPSSL